VLPPIWQVPDWIDPIFQRPPQTERVSGPGWNIRVCPWRGLKYQFTNNGIGSPQTLNNLCGLTGQAIGGLNYASEWDSRTGFRVFSPETETIRIAERNNPVGAGGGYAYRQDMVRDIAEGIGGVPFRFYHQPFQPTPNVPRTAPAFNPNPLRNLPSAPPSRKPDFRPGQGPRVDPVPDPVAEPGLSPSRRSYGPTPGRGPTRGVPVGRRPPGRGEKEKKLVERGLTRLILGVLDAVSEYAEIVDAFYDALPQSVRDRRPCSGGRGLLDQAGQYGIDAADCKARVLWDNWHRVDPAEAMLNLAKNVAEDQLHGLLHKNLPRNTGNAFEDAFRAIDDAIKNGPGRISLP